MVAPACARDGDRHSGGRTGWQAGGGVLRERLAPTAQNWMGHICSAQQGIPKNKREKKLRKFDVYDDSLATKLTVRRRGRGGERG
eukprot:3875268-Prymnesium_polylepis.1